MNNPNTMGGDGLVEWRCFHCDFVTSDRTEAELHFGPECFYDPMCKMTDAGQRREYIVLDRYYTEVCAKKNALQAELTASEALVTSLRNQLEGAKEALRPFAETGRGLITRQAGGWHRVNDFGRKEVVLDITFTDLEHFRLAASTLDRLEGDQGIGASVAGAEVAASTGVKSDGSTALEQQVRWTPPTGLIPTYEDAVELVTAFQNPSVSFVQRKLQLGYARAASFIERMQDERVCSRPNHTGKRQMLVRSKLSDTTHDRSEGEG